MLGPTNYVTIMVIISLSNAYLNSKASSRKNDWKWEQGQKNLHRIREQLWYINNVYQTPICSLKGWAYTSSPSRHLPVKRWTQSYHIYEKNKTKQNKRKKTKPDLVYLMQLHVKKKMDWNGREKETLFAHHTYSFFLNRVGEHCLTHKVC